jgi:hypothetical protein
MCASDSGASFHHPADLYNSTISSKGADLTASNTTVILLPIATDYHVMSIPAEKQTINITGDHFPHQVIKKQFSERKLFRWKIKH